MTLDDLELLPTNDLINELCQRETIRVVIVITDSIRNPPEFGGVACSHHLEPEEAKQLLIAALDSLP